MIIYACMTLLRVISVPKCMYKLGTLSNIFSCILNAVVLVFVFVLIYVTGCAVQDTRGSVH